MDYLQGFTVQHANGYEYYMDDDGEVVMALPFVENGTALSYHADGSVEFSIDYKDGIRHGTTTYNSYDGDSWATSRYVNGKRNGLSLTVEKSKKEQTETLYLNDEVQVENVYDYSPDDLSEKKIKSHTPYHNGVPHGDEIHYDADGNVMKTIPWEHGKKQGEAIERRPDGHFIKTVYEDGKVKGPLCEYNQDGRLVRKCYPKEDVVISYDQEERPVRVDWPHSHKEVDYDKGVIREIFDGKLVTQAFVWKIKGEVTDETLLRNQVKGVEVEKDFAYVDGHRYAMTAGNGASAQLAAEAIAGIFAFNCEEVLDVVSSDQQSAPLADTKKKWPKFSGN